jgi:tetratricopeptide (TPR) repeat protein
LYHPPTQLAGAITMLGVWLGVCGLLPSPPMAGRLAPRRAGLLVAAGQRAEGAQVLRLHERRRARITMQEEQPAEAAEAAPAPPADYDEAEARGVELYQAGEYERAIRLFELATTLPGAGVDYRRTSNQGMIGSATAPPNPRGMERTRFATPEQKLIAQYNIACCCAAMGDTGRTVDILRAYLEQVVEQPAPAAIPAAVCDRACSRD